MSLPTHSNTPRYTGLSQILSQQYPTSTTSSTTQSHASDHKYANATSFSGVSAASSVSSAAVSGSTTTASGPHASSSSISLDPALLPLLYRVELSVKYQVDEITRLINLASQNLSEYLRELLDGYDVKAREQVFRLGEQWGFAAELTMQNVYHFIAEDYENTFPSDIIRSVQEPANEIATEFNTQLLRFLTEVLNVIPFGNDFADWIKFRRKYRQVTTDTERLRHMYVRQEMRRMRQNFVKPQIVTWLSKMLLIGSSVLFAGSIYFYLSILHNVSLHAVFIFLLKKYAYFLMILLSVLHGWIIFQMREDSKKYRSKSVEEHPGSTRGTLSEKHRLSSFIDLKAKRLEEKRGRLTENDAVSSHRYSPDTLDSRTSPAPLHRQHFHNHSAPLLSHRTSIMDNSRDSLDEDINISHAPQSNSIQPPDADLIDTMNLEHSRGDINLMGGVPQPARVPHPDQQKRSHPKFLYTIIGASQFLIGTFCIGDMSALLPKDSPYYYIYHYTIPLLVMIFISLTTFIICSLGVVDYFFRGLQIAYDFYEFTAFPSLRVKWQLKRHKEFHEEIQAWINGMDYVSPDDSYQDALFTEDETNDSDFSFEIERSPLGRRSQRPSWQSSPPKEAEMRREPIAAKRTSKPLYVQTATLKEHKRQSNTFSAVEVPLSSVNSTPVLTASTLRRSSRTTYETNSDSDESSPFVSPVTHSTRLRAKDFSDSSIGSSTLAMSDSTNGTEPSLHAPGRSSPLVQNWHNAEKEDAMSESSSFVSL